MNQDATTRDNSKIVSGSSSTPSRDVRRTGDVLLEREADKSQSGNMMDRDGEADGERAMINPLSTYLVSHPERGNGVFAPTTLRAGTIIEDSPVLVITREQWADGKMDDCILGSYGFCWRNGGMGIGLGLASLFNHSSSPNVNFVRNYNNSTIRFSASRTIQAGEELCISYAADESKLWFVKSDPTPSSSGTVNGISQEEEVEAFPPIELLAVDEDDAEDRARRLARQARLDGSPREPGRRERKKAQYLAKKEAAEAGAAVAPTASDAIVQPTPTSSPAPRGENASCSSATPSRSVTPNYPAIPDRTVSSPALPAPLHSGEGKSRHEHVGPVILTPELDWREEDWAGSSTTRSSSREGSAGDGDEDADWGGIERIKGYTEREEDQQLADDQDLVDVWVVDVQDPRMVREVLHYSKECLRMEPELKHLKRVCRRRDADGKSENFSRVALCTMQEHDKSTLVESLSSFSPLLAPLETYIFAVPKGPARDQAELVAKHAIWPVTMAPPIRKQDASPRYWSPARRAWVEAGIKRVIALALEAVTQRGELPNAVYCTSPPTPLWPRMEDEGFIPPTPGLRAASHDTRVSETHPLRHANLNCIASIARLRTVPPFSEMQPTRNGADYLLTSLSLFTLHEPCTMCTMALLHSRVREVFYVFPSGRSGGFEGEFGLHSRKDLNHRFEVWKWKDVNLSEEQRAMLRIDDGVEI